MGRRPATALHLALSLIGAVLYFVFVIPRWWVLLGAFPTTLATVGRIAAAVPIALAAIPVVLFLQQSLKPENKTPEIALRLRAWSGVLHVVAGVLIAGEGTGIATNIGQMRRQPGKKTHDPSR